MNRSSRLLSLALALFLLGGCAANRAGRSTGRAGQERTAVLLAVNDVYRIEGVDGGTAGGIARLRTLREELERRHPDLLLLHAGDFLFPSFQSRMFNGEQMIDVLNLADGAAAGFDERMFAVFGNHEFEKDKKKDAPMLDQRIEESQFCWLGGNVTFAAGEDGQPMVAADNLARSFLVESGGIRIGIFGVTVDSKKPEYVTAIADPIATARELTADLRSRGAEVVVALTHLNAKDDRRLLEELGGAGPDLIIGGHDHEHMAVDAGGRWVLKADADARTATVATLTLSPAGRLTVRHELRELEGDSLRPDPQVQARVEEWLDKHEKLFCEKAGDQPGCLEQVLGHSQVRLDAEENKIRGSETNLGDWVADRMLAAFAECGAQAAFTNSGSLRLNQDLPPGEITRRHVEELFAYPAPLHLLRIDGSTLQKAVDHTVQYWPGSGSWLQVAGMAYTHDQDAKAARNLTLLASGGGRPVDPAESILVVTNDYLVNPQAGDQDGYTMLQPSQIVKDCAADGKDLKDLVIQDLKAAEPQGIAPAAEGRICQGEGKCLAVSGR
ncbi:MAG TPA: bifunctional UDP-sugar hydrolase/5'-nucleotidase [Thermoanaerobaculia bacterium]